MRPIATDGVAWSARVCVSVCLLVTFVSSAKTAERIEMLIRCRLGDSRVYSWQTPCPRNDVLHWVQIARGKGQFLGVVQLTKTHCELLLRCTQQKKSVTASARVLQPTALLQTVTLTSLSEKSDTFRCGVSSKF